MKRRRGWKKRAPPQPMRCIAVKVRPFHLNIIDHLISMGLFSNRSQVIRHSIPFLIEFLQPIKALKDMWNIDTDGAGKVSTSFKISEQVFDQLKLCVDEGIVISVGEALRLSLYLYLHYLHYKTRGPSLTLPPTHLLYVYGLR